MARKQSGGFNKLLNFIGLVDDDPRDTYGEEYQSDNYGRQAAYTPVRSSRNGRTASSRNAQPARRSLPAPSRTNRYDDRYERSDRASGGYDDYRASSRRPASRFEDDGYDYMPRTERAASRFAAEPSPRYEEPVQREAPVRAMRVSQRSRTVMFSLHTLEDCCEVIDHLIANNTVVLTMDELDGRLMQRAVDTLSGAVFALHASIRKASDKTYLIAPMSVEVNEAYDVDRGFR